ALAEEGGAATARGPPCGERAERDNRPREERPDRPVPARDAPAEPVDRVPHRPKALAEPDEDAVERARDGAAAKALLGEDRARLGAGANRRRGLAPPGERVQSRAQRPRIARPQGGSEVHRTAVDAGDRAQAC